MSDARKAGLVAILAVFGLLAVSVQVLPILRQMAKSPEATPEGDTSRSGTEEDLAAAREAWANSAHADTFDNGMGANISCTACHEDGAVIL